MQKPLPFEPIPSTLFVVELDKHIAVTSCQIKKSPFTCYRFDGNSQMAYRAAEDIALASKKLVANMVQFPASDPFIYDPTKYAELEKALLSMDDDKEYYAG